MARISLREGRGKGGRKRREGEKRRRGGGSEGGRGEGKRERDTTGLIINQNLDRNVTYHSYDCKSYLLFFLESK